MNIGDGRRAVFRVPRVDVLELLAGRVVEHSRTERRRRARAYVPRYTRQRQE